ncbi:MAG: hydantoinase, partial [Planctomycetota bacterium]
MSQGDRIWRFWIDVGGTFTDCLARDPNGAIHSTKLLSSGVIVGTVDGGATPDRIIDAARGRDPDGFYDGWRIDIEGGADGKRVRRTVRAFDARGGSLTLDAPLPATPRAGARYELTCDDEAPVIAVRWLMRLRAVDSIGPVRIHLGTTRATNALLERQGARTALLTTA